MSTVIRLFLFASSIFSASTLLLMVEAAQDESSQLSSKLLNQQGEEEYNSRDGGESGESGFFNRSLMMMISDNDVTNRTNLTIEELMRLELAEYPIRDPLSIGIPMSLIYSLILLSGLVGNVSTCVVIAKITYMHTATNYYLFSLAMSDLLLLTSGVPQEIYHIWNRYPYIFGEIFCVLRGLAAETSANATVLTITAFTVERFVAIVYPLKSHLLSQLTRVRLQITVIWILALCMALPQAAQFGVLDSMSRHDPARVLIKGAWCTLVREIFPYAFQISICVFFIIPMTIISVLYVLIGLKLRKPRMKMMGLGPLSSSDDHVPVARNTQGHGHVIRMLVAVVVGFFICWAPFHAQRLMALHATSVGREALSPLFVTVYNGLMHVSGVLYYASTCINPILYHIMSHKFRQAFKDTMTLLCGRNSEDSNAAFGIRGRTFSSASHISANRLGYMNQYKSGSNSSLKGLGKEPGRVIVHNGNGSSSNGHLISSRQTRSTTLLSTIEESESGHCGAVKNNNSNIVKSSQPSYLETSLTRKDSSSSSILLKPEGLYNSTSCNNGSLANKPSSFLPSNNVMTTRREM